jgi:beta-glucosidase
MDIDNILGMLTLEEKVALASGADYGFTVAVKRLGVPRILMVDGPHGVRVMDGTDVSGDTPYSMLGGMRQSTAYPCEAAMASTWNAGLIRSVGKQIGEECAAYGVSVILAPGVNGKRSPLCGRNFEYYSEDPYLSGIMAAEFIKGVQSQGVGACLKHYVLNEQETRRTSVDVYVDDRALWEIYLKPFEMAIKEAKPWAVMASYNSAFGSPVTENEELLVGILRNKLGFDGVVMSDWGAVRDSVIALKSGINLEMPGPGKTAAEMGEAVKSGLLSAEKLDTAVRHVLEMVDKSLAPRQEISFNWEEHHQLAVRVSLESTVLLKNAEDLLPLPKSAKVLIVGDMAQAPVPVGGGSSSLLAQEIDVPLDCMRNAADVSFVRGFDGIKCDEDTLQRAKAESLGKDAVIIFVSRPSTEGLDRTDICFTEGQLNLIAEIAAVNGHTILINQSGFATQYSQVEANVQAILHAFVPGEGFGKAITQLIFGDVSPSGKLSETIPVSLQQVASYTHFPGYKDNVCYNEGLMVGYRYHDTCDIAPMYPFGFGLSYTTFEYRNMRLSTEEMKDGDVLTVSIDITNTGNMEGMETVQVYVRDEQSELLRPYKELKGFAKISLIPQETRTVTIELGEDAFAYYVPGLLGFAVESGFFEIMAGASSKDIRASMRVYYDSDIEVRPPLTRNDLVQDFAADSRYDRACERFLNDAGVTREHQMWELVMGSSPEQNMIQYLGFPLDKCEEMYQLLLGGNRGMEV